jgi:hypothetical protein
MACVFARPSSLAVAEARVRNDTRIAAGDSAVLIDVLEPRLGPSVIEPRPLSSLLLAMRGLRGSIEEQPRTELWRLREAVGAAL